MSKLNCKNYKLTYLIVSLKGDLGPCFKEKTLLRKSKQTKFNFESQKFILISTFMQL